VLLAIDRAGVVGADGETHQGIYDISFLRILPKMVIMTPSNEQELWKMLTTGFNYRGPSAVRYPRGFSLGIDFDPRLKEIELGKAQIIRQGNKIAYLVFGTLLQATLSVAEELNATVVDMRFVKPLDVEMIEEICSYHDYVITIEENVVLGGAGSAVNEVVLKSQLSPKIHNLGIPDRTIMHGPQDEILSEIGLDKEGIKKSTLNLTGKNVLSKQN
jgi:1-deoxy-D-xylulose-5-phosphate synthase